MTYKVVETHEPHGQMTQQKSSVLQNIYAMNTDQLCY